MKIVLDKVDGCYYGDILLSEKDIEMILDGQIVEAYTNHHKTRYSLGCVLRKGLDEEET